MPTLLRHATQKPPIGPLKLDIGHPLARSMGLCSAYVLSEFGSALVNDAIRPGIGTATLSGSTAPTWVSSSGGPALNFVAASSQLITVPNTPGLPGGTPVTVTAQFTVSTFAADRKIVAWWLTPANWLLAAQADGTLLWVFGSVSNALQLGSSAAGTIVANKLYTAVCWSDGTTGGSGAILNGVNQSLTWAPDNAGIAAGNTGNIMIGAATDGGFHNGTVGLVLIGNRSCGPAAALQICAEPYCMFQAMPDRRWFGNFAPIGHGMSFGQQSEVGTCI